MGGEFRVTRNKSGGVPGLENPNGEFARVPILECIRDGPLDFAVGRK